MKAENRRGEKIWADAVKRAVYRRLENEEGKPQKLERLADKLVDAALDGDIAALREIGDRLDGKPVQAVSGDPENPLTMVHTIERHIIGPDTPD